MAIWLWPETIFRTFGSYSTLSVKKLPPTKVPNLKGFF